MMGAMTTAPEAHFTLQSFLKRQRPEHCVDRIRDVWQSFDQTSCPAGSPQKLSKFPRIAAGGPRLTWIRVISLLQNPLLWRSSRNACKLIRNLPGMVVDKLRHCTHGRIWLCKSVVLPRVWDAAESTSGTCSHPPRPKTPDTSSNFVWSFLRMLSTHSTRFERNGPLLWFMISLD